jgi:NADH:ubiquinone oxidoreductase subunit D
MRQSIRIIQQAINRGLPGGPVMVDNPYVSPCSKAKVYNEMESLIYHFADHEASAAIGEYLLSVERRQRRSGLRRQRRHEESAYPRPLAPACFLIFEAY